MSDPAGLENPTSLRPELASAWGGRDPAWLEFGLLALAVVARSLCGFPLYRSPTEPDALLGGLCGLRVLHGEFPIFAPSGRFGPSECYVAALVTTVVGHTREALAIAALLLGVGQIIFHFLFLSELLGAERRRWALPLIALVPPAVLYWTTVLNGYAAIMMLSTAALWLTARLARRGGLLAFVITGMTMGLAFWQSLLALTVIVPSAGFLLWRRPSARRPGLLTALILAFAAGASPWLAFNLRHRGSSLRENYAAHPVANLRDLAANAGRLSTQRVPELLANIDYRGEAAGIIPGLLQGLRPAVLAVYVILTGAALAAARGDPELRAASALAASVIGSVVVVNLLSVAGAQTTFSERFLITAWLAATVLCTMGLHFLAHRRRVAALVLLTPIVIYSALAVAWPGTKVRSDCRRAMIEEDAAFARLEASGVTAVVGSYWSVYALNFFSGEKILGLPCHDVDDYLGYWKRASLSPQRWALAHRRAGARAWFEGTPPQWGYVMESPGWTLLLPRDHVRVLSRDDIFPELYGCALSQDGDELPHRHREEAP